MIINNSNSILNYNLIFLYSYIKTHGDNLDELKKLSVNDGKNILATKMTIVSIATFVLIMSVILMFGRVIYYFVKIDDSL